MLFLPDDVENKPFNQQYYYFGEKMNIIFHLMSIVFAQENIFDKDDIIIEDYPHFNAQSFRPSIDSQSFFWVTDSSLLHNKYMYKALLIHTDSPLIYTDPNGQEYQVVDQINELNLIGSYRYKKARVGLAIPLFVETTGLLNQQLTQTVTENAYSEDTNEETKFGDIMVDAKFQLLEGSTKWLGLASSARLTLPTSNSSLPLGSDGPVLELELNADKKISNFRMAANIGSRMANKTELLDALNQTWGSGAYSRWGLSYDLEDAKGVSFEYVNGLMYNKNTKPSNEALFSFWTPWERQLVKAGLGFGLGEGIGTPKYRILISLEPESVLAIDSDRDTVVDAYDMCPTEAEDIDGVLDSDGCFDDEDIKTPVFAIGDLKADVENAKKIFQLAGIIDEEDNWLQKDIIVVQVGDLIDQEYPSDDLLKWLKYLEQEAKRNNSKLYLLLGDKDVDLLQNKYSLNLDRRNKNKASEKNEQTIIRPTGIRKEWLLQHDSIIIEEGNLFSHGGLSVSQVDDPEELSKKIRQAMKTKQISPLLQEKGPLKHQDYWTEPEDKACFEVDVVLSQTNSSRLITSHPTQTDGKIKIRCNGRLINIDTGISQYYEGDISAIKIEGDTITAIYRDRTEVILENNKLPSPPKEKKEEPKQKPENSAPEN